MASVFFALALISTGLYAGFMLTFRISVMPALARLPDDQFLPAMRRINEVVPRPLFLILFFSIVVFPALGLAVPVEDRGAAEFWLLAAGLACSVINHLITIGGNIPLNNALAASEGAPRPGGAGQVSGPGGATDHVAGGEGAAGDGAEGAGGVVRSDREVRAAFEPRWNSLHLVRTLFTVAAFASIVASALA
jgi:uncharacterized membrane protein